jgi:hypothetical protein
MIQYYWMDSSTFRIARTRRTAEPVNFRNCLGHWWLAMQSEGLGRDPVQLRHLLLACGYPLVSRNNALQHIYRDAHLASGATAPADRSLPETERKRINSVVRSRDRERVRTELERLLAGPAIPAEERGAVEILLDGILRQGVALVQSQGSDGLEQFLGQLDAWYTKRRKKGGQDWHRRFLDFFAYECKASFYRCYSNCWIDLIPWLQRHRGLDKISERFLRFWHLQNQPVERPDGVVIPDGFHDQVLSLHPLSGFFMKDPAFRAVAGAFFSSDVCDRYLKAGQGRGASKYWDLIGAILTAGHLYRQALEDQAQRRGIRERRWSADALAQVSNEPQSPGGLLEEFITARGVRCSQCDGVLRMKSFRPAGPKATSFCADFFCSVCDLGTRVSILRADLERTLMEEE